MSEVSSVSPAEDEPERKAAEAARLRRAAWDWVDSYRLIMWEAHNPTPGISVNWEASAMFPPSLDEPLRSAVKELLETFPDNWFEKERLATFEAAKPLPASSTSNSEPSRGVVAARLGTFIVGTIILFLLYTAIFGSSLGLLGSLVDAVPPLWRSQIINGLASAGFLYAIRVWIAMWFGWMEQTAEQVLGLVILWVGLSLGLTAVYCSVFKACPAPALESGCSATPSREGPIIECQ